MTDYFSDTFRAKTATEFALLEEIKYLRARLYVTDPTFGRTYLEAEPVKLTATKALPDTITLRKSASLVANIADGKIVVRVEGGHGDTRLGGIYTADTYFSDRPNANDAARYVSYLSEDFQRRLAEALLEGKWK